MTNAQSKTPPPAADGSTGAGVSREDMPTDVGYRAEHRKGRGPAPANGSASIPTTDPLPSGAGDPSQWRPDRDGNAEADELPPRVGRLEVRRLIARGGMGAVAEVHDPELQRQTALKILLRKHRGDDGLRRKFEEEGRITAKLQHPGIPPVYARGHLPDGTPYFTMKLVRGETLGQRLKSGRPLGEDLPALVKIFEHVCHAIGYAHSRQVIHRDLKPNNVMLGAFGEVQVMDWGLAKELDSEVSDPLEQCGTWNEDAVATAAGGKSVGTPSYIPPEQARGDAVAVDLRSDVFGLGAILCRILTGRPPFDADHSRVALARSIEGDLTGAYERLDRCGAHPTLVALAKDCLSADPRVRPRDAGELADHVIAFRMKEAERLRRAELDATELRLRSAHDRRIHRLRWASGVVLLLATAVAVGVVAWHVAVQSRRQDRALARVRQRIVQAHRLHGEALAARDGAEVFDRAIESAEQARGLLSTADLGHGLETQVQDLLATLHRERRAAEDAQSWRFRTQVLRRAIEHLRFQPDPADLRPSARRLWRKVADALELSGDGADDAAAVRRLLDDGLPDDLADELGSVALRTQDPSLRRILLEAWTRLRPEPTSVGPTALELAQAVRDADLSAARRLREAFGPQTPCRDLLLLTDFLVHHDPSAATLAWAERVQRAWPDAFWANQLAAVACLDQSPPRVPAALRYLTAGVALRPQSASARVALARTLVGDDQPQKALEQLRHAVRVEPDFAPARLELGRLLAAQGDRGGAHQQFELAGSLDPHSAAAACALAENHLAAGRPLAALRTLHAAGGRFADDPEHLHCLSRVEDALGRLAESVRHGRAAVQSRPRQARWWYDLATAEQRRGELAAAEAAYRQALELDGDMPLAQCRLGEVLIQQGRMQDGLPLVLAGHDRGSRRADWSYPSAQWCERARTLASMPEDREGLRQHAAAAATVRDRLYAAQLQRYRGDHAGAARTYRRLDADAGRPLPDDSFDTEYHAWLCDAQTALADPAGSGASDRTPERLRARLLRLVTPPRPAPAESLAASVRLEAIRSDVRFEGLRQQVQADAALAPAQRRRWTELFAAADRLAQDLRSRL